MADKVGASGGEATEIRTFLIADVRGYTLFTQERGDEAAAKLAMKFAELAREGVEGRGGSVIELDTGSLDYLTDLVDRLDLFKQIEKYVT